MANRDYRHFTRSELLEMLIAQKKENARLQEEAEQLRAALADRELRMKDVGTMAEAALALNDIYRATDAAARQYLDSIAAMVEKTRRECDEMLMRAEEKARRISGETDSVSGTEKA